MPSRATRRVAAGLLAAYSLAVVVIVAWPTPVDREAHGLIIRVLKGLHRRDLLMFLGYPQLEFLANVAMFVPLGLLVGILFGRRLWGLAVLLGFGVSAAIELFQFVVLPDRFATVDDVIANTLGALVGALIAGAVLRRLRDRSSPGRGRTSATGVA